MQMESNIKRYVFETTDDWKKFRQGMFTASRINELMAKPKNENEVLSVGAKSYTFELVCNIIAQPKLQYYSPSMEWGNEQEPQAVLRYASVNGYDINATNFIYTSVGGFVFFTDNDVFGGTPDIIITDKKRIVEIKCPDSDTHLYHLNDINSDNIQKKLPKYYDQMQLNMYLTDSEVCDFVSYDPRFKSEKLQYLQLEVKRDNERIEKILNKIKIANKLKEELLNKYKS